MLKRHFHFFVKEKTNNTFVQLFRHTVAGGIAFLVDFSILYLFKEKLHLPYQFGTVVGYSVGIYITYLFSIKWIFHNRKKKKKSVELSVFILLNLIGLALNSLFMWTFTTILGVYYLYSKLITTGIIFIWNFFSRKFHFYKLGHK